MIDHNIANAQYITIAIANYFAKSNLVGFFSPHSQTARFEKLAEAPESYYHALDDAIYDRACDGFILLPGWESSSGSRKDYNNAVVLERPVFVLMDYNDLYMNTLMQHLERWALEKEQ